MWIGVAVDDVARRLDIGVAGSPCAPVGRMHRAGRLLVLANDGHTFGRFSIEQGTGAVFYSISANVEGVDLGTDAISFAVCVAATRYDPLYPGLV